MCYEKYVCCMGYNWMCYEGDREMYLVEVGGMPGYGVVLRSGRTKKTLIVVTVVVVVVLWDKEWCE